MIFPWIIRTVRISIYHVWFPQVYKPIHTNISATCRNSISIDRCRWDCFGPVQPDAEIQKSGLSFGGKLQMYCHHNKCTFYIPTRTNGAIIHKRCSSQRELIGEEEIWVRAQLWCVWNPVISLPRDLYFFLYNSFSAKGSLQIWAQIVVHIKALGNGIGSSHNQLQKKKAGASVV